MFVTYAKEHNIEIIPAYPELNCYPTKKYEVRVAKEISTDILNIVDTPCHRLPQVHARPCLQSVSLPVRPPGRQRMPRRTMLLKEQSRPLPKPAVPRIFPHTEGGKMRGTDDKRHIHHG